ncbi:MAG: extracellular solute-binding protein [Deltaproteobacteria bacterium]|nr:MAG: extracellular solute-binding protein [Deltaproteobacteria bacterium]
MQVFCCVIIIVFLALNQIVYGAEAWTAEWERTIKAAEQEGEFSYYTLGEFSFLSEFEKRFPRVKVKVVQGKGNELLVRIMSERRAGKFLADVARIGNTSPYSLYQAKALQPIAGAFVLPEVKDESKWWSGKHQYIDAEGKYIFVPVGSVSVNMVAHNTELVSPTELRSFWDLLNEKWRAKIVVTDPRSGAYGRSGARTVYYHPQLGPEFLRRLFTEQVVMVSRDYRQAIDWVAQKRFSILKPKACRSTFSTRADGKKAAHWSRAPLRWRGWTGRLTQTLPRFSSTGCYRAKGKWRCSETAG